MVNRLGNDLIGSADDPLPGTVPGVESQPVPIERLAVDQHRLGPEEEDPINHPDGWAPGGPTPLPAGLTEFPAGRRLPLVLREAQMTTVDGDSHLFSFGEFAAMYVMVWCNACWLLPGEWPTARDVLAPTGVPPRPVAPLVDPPVDWDKLKPARLGEDESHERYAGCLEQDEPARSDCIAKAVQAKLIEKHEVKRDQLAEFVAGLPKVRRTLANVPTYMIFDDHDATDDWNLNPIWVDRVNNTSLGRTILRNALASYAVFQDWGNDPLRYLNERHDPGPRGDPQRLLDTIRTMFPEHKTEGPAEDVARTLDHLFGFDLRPQPTVDGP